MTDTEDTLIAALATIRRQQRAEERIENSGNSSGLVDVRSGSGTDFSTSWSHTAKI